MTSTDPARAGRLLRTEAAALMPVLRACPPGDLDRPTVLPGWSVRDVLAHCSAALGRAVTQQLHGFSPEENAQDVAARAAWPAADLLAELEANYAAAAATMDAAGGRLDGLALGEWVHGGDVRLALGRPDAFAGPGLDDALALLVERCAGGRVPDTLVALSGPGTPRELRLGAGTGAGSTGGPTARLATDAATLIRLCAGRSPDPARFTLTGAEAGDYLVFR